MGFNITFYKFNKEGNSTLRPASSGTTYNCRILRGSSLISPTIELSLGYTTAPDFNYAYIPNFNRYYYVSEWTYNEALWTAQLEVDVLATYRTEIGNENLYALRTSNVNLYDGRVVDNLYPTKTNCVFSSVSDTLDTWTLDGGVYVVGIVNKGLQDYRFGSVVYYIMNKAQFTAMVNYLLSDELLNDFNIDMSDISTEVQKSLIDPLQYIKSCVYIPLSSGALDLTTYDRTHVNVFSWSIWEHVDELILVPIIKPSEPSHKLTRTYNIPKHPQTNARGNYVNQKPYTNINLEFAPFGLIELDTSVTCNASSVTVDAEIDLPTGLGIMTVSCNGIILNRIEAQIGIPVQLTQVTRDYIGGVTSIISGVSGSVGSFLKGDYAGAISNTATGIGNAITSLTPRSQTIGTGGSYAQLVLRPRIEAQFFEIVDDDIAKNGRPCCKIVNCSSGGYFLIQDGDVHMSGTKAEWEMIKSTLETGFYWE